MTLGMRVLGVVLVTLFAAAACDSGGALPVPPAASSTALPAINPPAHVVVGRQSPDGGPFTLDITTGADSVRVLPGAVDQGLYRVATPTGSAAFPTVHASGTQVAVGVSGGGNADLTVVLNSSVRWDLRFSAGVGVIDVTLPAPSGARTITETAGASTLNVHLPKATPVTVHAVAGAGLVALYGQSHSGVAAGSTFRSGSGADRYTINAVGGVSSLTVSGVR
ncbi:MAG TPA: hypothetical protein VGH30_09915 [Jatrophihabitantaceae bacterium]